jgi:YD repeat-containing protein
MVNAGLGIQYDAAGNLTATGGFTFGYDAEGRLVSSTLNGVTTAYAYDSEGRRVKKGLVVLVYDAFGRLAAEYGAAADPAGTEYLTADHLGSTRLVTSATGAERRCLDYLPFGEQTVEGMGSRGACYASAAGTARQGQALAGAIRAALTPVLAGTPEAEIRAIGDCKDRRPATGAGTREPALAQDFSQTPGSSAALA